MTAGWQNPPERQQSVRPKCPHLGLVAAALTINRHPEGHIWKCTCGAEFVVVSDAGKSRRLVPKEGR